MTKGPLLLVGKPANRYATARYGFRPGEEIVRCPVVELSRSDNRLLRTTSLRGRLFGVGHGKSVFPFGYGALCVPFTQEKQNYNADAEYNPSARVLIIRSTREIQKGEPIQCRLCADVVEWRRSVILTDGKVRVKKTHRKGRGLFAVRTFSPGNMIERYPVLIIPSWERACVERTVLEFYWYYWGGGHAALVLGLWMLHNTSSDGTVRTSNTTYYQKISERALVSFCLKPISAGDELTTPYCDLSDPPEKLESYMVPV